MSTNVVPFPGVNLSDIPACLRRLAEQIEAGEITPEAMLVVTPVGNDWPAVFGFGADDAALSAPGVIGILEMAKHWFVHYATERK